MTIRDEYVVALEKENEDLRAQVARLEEVVGLRVTVPVIFALTGQETRLFGVLLRRDIVSKETALDALYGHRPEEDEAEIKIVDVFICKMRKKLKDFGIAIETLWGCGYYMTADTKKQVQAFIEAAGMAA